MSLWDRFLGKAPVPAPVKRNLPLSPRGLAGGRFSVDASVSTGIMAWGKPFSIVEPEDHEANWRLLELDEHTLDKISVDDLLRMLVDVSPDVSRALWDFLRMCNPGWEAHAYAPGAAAKDAPVDAQADKALQDFFARLKERYHSWDVPLNKLFAGMFLRGALAVELVLDPATWEPLDLATPDPASIRFRKVKRAPLGEVYIPGQWQGGKFRSLERPTFAYVPVDPIPGSPYGRAPVKPALFGALFLIGMLHDLRRVISQQGYPRLDISLDLEKLAAAMPADLEDDPAAFMQWVNQTISDVQSVYGSLQPDDAYVHTSVIEVNRPVGTVDANSLGAVEAIIKSLERMAIKSLKTMPLLMGVSEASTETHANRQWELYAQGIRSLQHLTEAALERMLQLALRAQGLQADVRFRFKELRAAEKLRDQQTLALMIANYDKMYWAGLVGQDEYAQAVIGHQPDQREPRLQMNNPQAEIGQSFGYGADPTDPGKQPSTADDDQGQKPKDSDARTVA